MSKDSKTIGTGSRVAIIGGGPAASLFALYLIHFTEKKGIHPEITIYQKRDFDEQGARGCKGCAGILSISLQRNLGELGLTIPEEIIQSKIEHYTVHSPYTSITISNPEKDMQIISVYRGGGPLPYDYDNPISFDGWLLREAQKRNIRVAQHRVSRIYLGPEARIEVDGKKLGYDLVVLASGVNTKPVRILGLEYVPPKTQIMAQDELYAGTAQVESRLSKVAHAFLIPHSGLIFGTLVPKGPFVNVSILSSGKYPVSVADFLKHELVQSVLPEHYKRTCGCRPRAVVSSAHNYYTDRFVAIGDAAVSRLYKDGIGSALLTARQAARTIVYHGISRHDFERYYQPFCSRIDRDNQWGRRLFSINDRIKDSRVFLLAQNRLIEDEQNNTRGPQPFTKATWGMFTGSYSYSSISRMILRPASLANLVVALLRESLKRVSYREATSPNRLHVGGKKVLILGSGFGGTYVLRHLVPALHLNENIETTMISSENFFLFSPLLHEVAMGRVEGRHIAYPIRRSHWRDRFNFIQASVEKIDLSGHKVMTTVGPLKFDYLVLALGSVTDIPRSVPTATNIFTLKTLHDSILIRNHIISVFEQASIKKKPEQQRQLLTFIVCGAGHTGVQLVTELRDFIYRTLLRFYRRIDPDNIRIILVEAEPKIIADLHMKLGAYVMKQLQHMSIEVRLKSRVTRVREGHVEINGSEDVPTSTIIWVAGMAANPRIAELDVEKDSLGRVLVNKYLDLPGIPRVYALGDCAHFEDPMSGQPIPPRAHTTVRQAKVVAHNILAEIRGKDKKPYRYSNTAEMVSLGTSKAVLRFHGLRVYGLPARFIWLVGYSLLATGAYNRIRLIMDWLLSFVFGRDTNFIDFSKPRK